MLAQECELGLLQAQLSQVRKEAEELREENRALREDNQALRQGLLAQSLTQKHDRHLHKHEKQEKGYWQRLNVLFDSLPKDHLRWNEKRSRLGLNSPHGIVSAFNSLLLIDAKNSCVLHEPRSSGRPDLKEFLMWFGKMTATRLRDVTELEPIARYRVMVFLAICEVALFAKQSSQIVEPAQREFHKLLDARSDISAASLTRNRRAAKWLVGRSDALCAKFGGRFSIAGPDAFEAMLHGNATLGLYVYASSFPKNNQQYISRIPAIPSHVPHSLFSFHIPFLVSIVTGYSFSIACRALGSTLFAKEDCLRWTDIYYKESSRIGSCPAAPQSVPVSARMDDFGLLQNSLAETEEATLHDTKSRSQNIAISALSLAQEQYDFTDAGWNDIAAFSALFGDMNDAVAGYQGSGYLM